MLSILLKVGDVHVIQIRYEFFFEIEYEQEFVVGIGNDDIFSGIDLGSILESLFGVVLAEVIFGLSGVAILGMLGAGFVYSGIRSLSRPE